MTKNSQIEVQSKLISIVRQDEQDYICLTDMVKGEEGSDHIRNWMRNRNTVEFLGLWETLNNPDFKPVEFDTFRKQAGLNSFNLTPRKWIEATNAIELISKSGRYGGTYAHKDLAFEFGSWISPMFKLLLIKEYQRLKEIESNQYNLEWNVKRILTKTNYQIHTDAVKDCILPDKNYEKDTEWLIYAEEADLLNVALFNCTAKDWRDPNPGKANKGLNIRDFASINELYLIPLKINNFNRMKAVFIFIFLFGFYSIASGQEEFIELQHEPVDFKAEGFFIKNVIDGRADKESIGFVQKGIFKKTKVRASFKHGLETAIYNYLEKSLRQDKTSVPVVLRITHLNISESQSLPVKGKAEVRMEFFRKKNGSLGKLYEAEAFVEKPAMNVTKTHEERIREVIITCLESFNKSDWQSVTPMFFKEREN